MLCHHVTGLTSAIGCVIQWLGPSGAPSSGSVSRIFCKGLEGPFCRLPWEAGASVAAVSL